MATTGSSSRSTSRPSRRRRARSTSTSSSTAAPGPSTSPWRPTTSSPPSMPCAPTASSSSTPPTATTRTPSCASASATSACRSRSSSRARSSSTATRTATSCRSSPSPSATARRSSSSSSSGTARSVSARATSRRCSRPSSASRSGAEASEAGADWSAGHGRYGKLGSMSQRAGWYDDPENPEYLRYFDGVVWTSHTSPRVSPSATQSPIGLAQQQPAQPGTQPVPQSPTQQLPYGGGQPQDTSQPPQYGQQPPQYGQQPPQYGQQPPQYGQYPPAPQYGPPGYPPGGYGAAPTAYGSALGVKTTPDGVPLASYGQRVGAWFIDVLIQLAITTIAGWYWLSQFVTWYSAWFTQIMNEAESGTSPALDQTQLSDQIMGYVLPISLISFLVSIVYQVGFLTWRGAT